MKNSCEGVTDESAILAFIDSFEREASYSAIACYEKGTKGN
jgi:hypothetical protein